MAASDSWKAGLWPEWCIECEIGSGSFGRVYKIRRQDIGGTYYAALKVISVPGDEEEMHLRARSPEEREQLTACYDGFAKELSREFAVMERLKGNTNIVSYEDHKIIPRADGIGWDVLIRMELLTPMLDHLGRSDCPEPEAIRLGIDICNALALCQRENIIHRDIKPGNIFINHYGDYKLGDFGVALNAGLVWTERSARGTYPYMAPEVFRGGNYDATVDTYALGLILYRLLNHGRAPFLPPPPAPLSTALIEDAHRRRIAGERLPRPEKASAALSAVILKACAPDPRMRYPSAMGFKRDLEQCALRAAEAEVSVHGGKFLRRDSYETLPATRPPEPKREISEWDAEQEARKAKMEQVFQFAGDL